MTPYMYSTVRPMKYVVKYVESDLTCHNAYL